MANGALALPHHAAPRDCGVMRHRQKMSTRVAVDLQKNSHDLAMNHRGGRRTPAVVAVAGMDPCVELSRRSLLYPSILGALDLQERME
jgi:hypothetical protein